MASNPDRLTGLDSSFLHLERDGAHMHVASVMVFEGDPPAYDELVAAIESRLHLVPRYRQRLAFVPLEQGRPVWVDDPYFNLRYHLRHTALAAPGDEDSLRQLAGRVFSQQLDRAKPLWEIWLVEGLSGGRFALLAKTHHALVDGVSGVDIATVLFDLSPEGSDLPPAEQPWTARPLPSGTQLLTSALRERMTTPREIGRGVRAALRAPRQALGALEQALAGIGAMAWAGIDPAPATPLNVPIGPHRRFTWMPAELARFKEIKTAMGGTVNDVVLTVVAGALGRFLRRRGQDTDGLVLKAMVPVSVRADSARGALGNQVATMWAPLPVGEQDAAACFAQVHEAMAQLKQSGQAVGAQVLTDLTGFAPPTIMSQAMRLQARQRFFNLVVTNVPGPQVPLYLLGRRLEAIYPMVPLAQKQALGIAIMSYHGQLNFGFVGDYDVVPDLEDLVADTRQALDELALAAGVGRIPRTASRRRPPTRRPAPATR